MTIKTYLKEIVELDKEVFPSVCTVEEFVFPRITVKLIMHCVTSLKLTLFSD